MHRWTVFLMMCFALSHSTFPGIAGPTPGSHSVTNYSLGQNTHLAISSLPMNTQPSGSTMLVCIGRGAISAFTQVPTDNKSNAPYVQLGSTHPYIPLYPDSGTALYACSTISGGSGYIVTTTTLSRDEVTLDAVEIKNGGTIQDYKWNEVLQGSPLTSLDVVTTRSATLVAFWWGYGNQYFAHTAVPDSGFAVIDSILPIGSYVQTAVAVKNVTNPGSYHVTWNSGGNEGAQLWLVAVQSLAPPTLQAQFSSGNVIVSWPGWATNYGLEATTDFSASNAWMPVTNAPTMIGSQIMVTNVITQPSRYYRLQKQ
jgi:hypothetical protein